MAKKRPVPRPGKKTDYEIVPGTRQAEVGWRDLRVTNRNQLTDAWDFLTAHPQRVTSLSYPFKGDLATIIREGQTFERWQLKLSQGGDARIWYYIDGNTVVLEQVHTKHPNETK